MTLDEYLREYRKFFGENYPLVIVSNQTDDEVIREIQACLESGTPANTPEYEEGLIY